MYTRGSPGEFHFVRERGDSWKGGLGTRQGGMIGKGSVLCSGKRMRDLRSVRIE